MSEHKSLTGAHPAAPQASAAAQAGIHIAPWTTSTRQELNPYIERLETIPEWVVSYEEAARMPGRWQQRFRQVQPLYLDIGAGYGHFLTELAPQYPERNFLGLELKYKRLYRAALRTQAAGLQNVQYFRFDALLVAHAFAPQELDGVYVNFPDPWPRKGQHRKRIVSPTLARTLEIVLKPGGTVLLKSDWAPNREHFKEAFLGTRFEMTDYVEDLEAWHRSDENIVTSYERRFRREGRVCFLYEFVLRG